jgi:hypothetical protein
LFSIHDHFPNIIFPRKKVKKVRRRARAAKCDTSFAAIMRAQRNRAVRDIGVMARPLMMHCRTARAGKLSRA